MPNFNNAFSISTDGNDETAWAAITLLSTVKNEEIETHQNDMIATLSSRLLVLRQEFDILARLSKDKMELRKFLLNTIKKMNNRLQNNQSVDTLFASDCSNYTETYQHPRHSIAPVKGAENPGHVMTNHIKSRQESSSTKDKSFSENKSGSNNKKCALFVVKLAIIFQKSQC